MAGRDHALDTHGSQGMRSSGEDKALGTAGYCRAPLLSDASSSLSQLAQRWAGSDESVLAETPSRYHCFFCDQTDSGSCSHSFWKAELAFGSVGPKARMGEAPPPPPLPEVPVEGGVRDPRAQPLGLGTGRG